MLNDSVTINFTFIIMSLYLVSTINDYNYCHLPSANCNPYISIRLVLFIHFGGHFADSDCNVIESFFKSSPKEMLIDFRERGRGGGKEGEKHRCEEH